MENTETQKQVWPQSIQGPQSVQGPQRSAPGRRRVVAASVPSSSPGMETRHWNTLLSLRVMAFSFRLIFPLAMSASRDARFSYNGGMLIFPLAMSASRDARFSYNGGMSVWPVE
ncbi:hypothetical protein CRUP_010528 [Coryphaenoides rupestris]|nr:hypothetical protein CRUP_010528 [Coryphaenoides rupestris]